MALIHKKDWKPVDIAEMEPNAWEALRASCSTCVTAGPGAGKTEFLAQRATYLLQTGLCPAPQRILAISFKRDAARNLQERVNQRCPPEQARRFVSMTYDAFAKSLLDRFMNVIPRSWRPQSDYILEPLAQRDIATILQSALNEAQRDWKELIAGLPQRNYETHWLGCQHLQSDPSANPAPAEWLLQYWWKCLKTTGKGGRLTYTMVNRLAEFILRTHPKVCNALRVTYPYVFLDEFQDTTYAQYGLVTTAFHGSTSVLTAVGDNKQRIMVWAGAMPDAFHHFADDFKAAPISLLCNYRSRPELVAIQHVVAQALETGSPAVESRALANIGGTYSEIWNFPGQNSETQYLAQWLANDAQEHGLKPRDYCILVRQKADDFEKQLCQHFDKFGLRLRNESRLIEGVPLQDLLVEEISQIVLHILTATIRSRAPESLGFSYDAICDLRGVDKENTRAVKQARHSLELLIKKLKPTLKSAPTRKDAQLVTQIVIDFIDPEVLRRSSPRYALGDTLDNVIAALLMHVMESSDGAETWEAWLEEISGEHHIPLMTIHKSKGLEFHTVFFLGLDDTQWWSHKSGDHESLATFFVALSRAKQRVFFTYCRNRAKAKVSDLYTLLNGAGIGEVLFE